MKSFSYSKDKFWPVWLTLFFCLAIFLSGCGRSPDYLKESGTGEYLAEDLSRDQKINRDIAEIRSALLAYAQVKKTFPPSLQSLVPEYLEEIPASPLEGESYSYQAELLVGNYQLKYKTSDGIEHVADVQTTDLKLKEKFDQPK
jgi:hypothetical protein